MHSLLEIGNTSRHADLTVGDICPFGRSIDIAALDGPAHLPEGAKPVLSKKLIMGSVLLLVPLIPAPLFVPGGIQET